VAGGSQAPATFAFPNRYLPPPAESRKVIQTYRCQTGHPDTQRYKGSFAECFSAPLRDRPTTGQSKSSRDFKHGGGKGIRTPDLLIANETLYQLSYTPTSTLLLTELRRSKQLTFASVPVPLSSGKKLSLNTPKSQSDSRTPCLATAQIHGCLLLRGPFSKSAPAPISLSGECVGAKRRSQQPFRTAGSPGDQSPPPRIRRLTARPPTEGGSPPVCPSRPGRSGPAQLR
jgi:hypothetical protein